MAKAKNALPKLSASTPTPVETVDIFLCHNGADKAWVEALAEQVESETFDGLPTGRKLRVWFDQWDIDKGQNFVLEINKGLAQSRFVGVVISPEMLQAPWPAFEWTHIVADDPTNRKGRLLPLFVRDYSEKLQARADFPAPFKALNWFDFRKKGEFKKVFRQLIAKLRDQRPPRGRQRTPLASAAPLVTSVDRESDAPDTCNEIILGNLLPVVSYPQTIWSAATSCRLPTEVWAKVKDAAPFELKEERLYTFADLSAATEPLRAVINPQTVRTARIGEWKADPVRWKWVVSLLNRCIRHRVHRLAITRDERGRFFFRPNQDGTDRVWQNGRDAKRTVAAKKENPDKSQSFWVHHAAWLSFLTLGDRLYLQVEPCYVFTSDGNISLKGKVVTPLSVKWGGKERNAAILRHIVFWGRTLSSDKVQIHLSTGGQDVVVSSIPAHAQARFGIADDSIQFKALLEQVDDELELVANELSDEVLSSLGQEGSEDDESPNG